VDRKLAELAKRMEEHELSVWTTCVSAAAALPGNPLNAVIDRSGRTPLVALGAIDRCDINRVIALGIRAPAGAGDVEDICFFYDAQQQRNFRIEVTPLTRPPELAGYITRLGLACDGLGTFKMWRRVGRPPAVPSDIEVRRLGPGDTEALTAVNVAAWGSWSMPVTMTSWFGATVGRVGVQHYGVFDKDRLLSTGALFVGDGLGWLGFDATHPRYQGRKFRQAISSVRMIDAAAQGCQMVHVESALPPSGRALDDGWQLLYEKQNFSSVPVDVGVAASSSSGARRLRGFDAPSDHS
jgi:hypothetical protein